MATTSVTYTGDGVETTYLIPFPFITAADIVITVGGVVVTDYTITSGSVTFGTAPSNGAAIVIARDTSILNPAVIFTGGAGYLPEDLEKMSNQLRYSLQELENILTSITSGDASTISTTTGASQFVVSISDGSGGFEWSTATLDEVKVLLGVDSLPSLPTPPGSGFTVLTSTNGSLEYLTASQVRDDLGLADIAISVPNPTGEQQFVVPLFFSGSNQYRWSAAGPSLTRTRLGLGTAATKNVGTTANSVVQLDALAQLPAVPLDNATLDGIALSNYATRTKAGVASASLATGGATVDVDLGFVPDTVTFGVANGTTHGGTAIVSSAAETLATSPGWGNVSYSRTGTTITFTNNTSQTLRITYHAVKEPA
jgi:hypothetical protein